MITTVGKEMGKAMMETLEQLAFMDVYADNEVSIGKYLEQEEDCFTSSIDLKSPQAGTLVISMPSILLDTIASVIYNDGYMSNAPESPAVEDQDAANPGKSKSDLKHSKETLFDVLSEILNTLAGNFLSIVVPEEKVFSIGFPVTVLEKPEEKLLDKTENWLFYKLQEKFICAVYIDI
ncbi:MAG: hypothetical protein JXR91_06075 [Deltaproteobacteria bacterium]|nr:hypothetical protein [Deltaproteobacteria bacterium]